METLYKLIVSLLLLFAFKHFVADFYLQNVWIVRGKRRTGLRFVLPLLTHAGIHGITTLLSLVVWFLIVDARSWDLILYVGGADFVSHAVIDRTKALTERLSENKKFRLALMLFDQLLHGLFYLLAIYIILTYLK